MTASKKNKTQKPAIKITRHIFRRAAGGCILAIGGCIGIASILFLNADRYKNDLQTIVQNSTGFNLDYDKLKTGFTWYGQPYIIINNLRVSSIENHNQFFKLKQLHLTLSYASLWHFMPIFEQIIASDSDLNFEFDKNNHLLLNRQLILDLNHPTKSDFNFSKWLIYQKNIDVKNIDVVVLDSKHEILPLIIDDIKFNLNHDNDYENQLSLEAKLAHSKIKWQLEFDGDDLNDYKTWSDAVITVNSIGNRGYLVNAKAEVHDGEIQYIKGNLDSNKNTFTSYSKDYGDVNNFKGQLSFVKTDTDKYKLTASDLTLNTEYGYLFRDAKIDGNVKFDHGGSLNVTNLNLSGLNSLLKYSQNEQRLEFSGDIKTVNVKWSGKMLKPEDLNFTTTFQNVALKSSAENIPSFNNLSGSIYAEKSTGTAQLVMNNSQISAPKYLHQPIKIAQLQSSIKWQIESHNTINVSWLNSSIKTPDFNILTNGNFSQKESNLQSTIKIDNVNMANIYKYLPLSIDKATVNDLQKNLTGHINDTTITINGNPRKLPFTNGGGKLAIIGKVNHANYLYANGWPKLSNVSGNISGTNQKLNFKTTSAEVGNLSISSGTISIADISSKSPMMTANGELNSNSKNFIDFILNTPLKKDIQSISEKIVVDGTAKTLVKMQIPMERPEKLTLDGQYMMYDNTLSLKDDESSNLQNISGKINFNQSGFRNGKLDAKLLGSNLEINIPNNHQIDALSPDFNYASLIDKINPKLETIISGRAKTNFAYDMNTEILKISSDLESVIINAPKPLQKVESINSTLDVSINFKDNANTAITNYNNVLFNTTQFTPDWKIKKSQIGIGTNNLDLAQDSDLYKISIKAKLENTYIDEWSSFVNQLSTDLKSDNKNDQIENDSESQNITNLDNKESEESIYPIGVEWNSNAFWYKNYNFDRGYSYFTVYPKLILGQIVTPDIEGKIAYSILDNHVSVDMHRLIIDSKNYSTPNYKIVESIVSSSNESGTAIVEESENTITEAFNPDVASLVKLKPESGINSINSLITKSNDNQIANNEQDETIDNEENIVNIPSVDFIIHNLYLQNYYLGEFRGNIFEQHDELYMDNATIKNNAGITRINMINHCVSCEDSNNKYVALNIHSDVNNFGNTMLKIDQGDMFKNGSGSADISAIWSGGIEDFNAQNLIAYASIYMKNGIVNVKPGIFGALMGVINFSALNITNMNHFNFNSFFGQSFAYDSLNSNLYLEQGDLHIEKLELFGDVADVSSFGNYYLESKTVDTYLTVQPKIAGTIATTAGIVTLNPIIGGIIYLAQKLIGDPINKALAISYHVHGDVNNPTMTQTKISKQILQNFKSSINLLPNDDNE